MSTGITTVVSTSAIPEKLQESADRMAEHKHQATSNVVQAHAEQKVKTVQKSAKSESTLKVKEREDEERKRREKERKKREGRGGNLDLQA